MRTPFLLLTGLFACFSVYGQTTSSLPEKIRQVETHLLPILIVEGDTASQFSLEARMKHYKVPGVSLAVIRNGKIEWAKGYGFADQEANRRVDTTTLFQASSISKPIAALAALHWVEAGKFALDSNINNYLKDWQVPDSPLTATEKVTLRRLMTNTAGLTVHGFAGYPKGKSVPTLIQILNGETPANSRAIQLDTIPGKVNRNPGGGYVVLQKAMIDQVGKPFPEIMQETVLAKLGMTRSTYEQPLPAKLDSMAATAYTSYGTPVNGSWYTYPEMAAAGLWSTPSDLARYVINVQQSLQGKSNKVISKPMAKQMLTKHLGSMGLGPALRNTGDSLIFSQSGGNQGFRCLFMAHATKGDGVVIMTNADSGLELAQELLNSVSAAYKWDFSTPKRMKKANLSTAQVEQVLGNYRRDRYIFEVTQTDGKLYAKPRWEEESREMIPEDKAQFIMRDGQRAEFIYDSNSKVTAVKLFGNVIFTKMSK
ncbi:serine hydrolase domain-containing protein [Spirosoma validum]|uniref:Serine hydrolase n=1 Tax=Spirosoma validum TaxID=2771355 RepID=A0A927B468_9BACT|nr:serine hydrolase domain-containing protein [Spirosoma validum]MBD2754966.1 serine hydrolase [Spirosoma validum]